MSETTTNAVPPAPAGHVLTDAEARLWETTGEGLKRSVEEAQAPGRPAILDHMTPSGLRQKYVVEMADGRLIEVQTGLVDVLRWERHYKKPWFDAEGMSVSRLMFITWAALKRTGVDVGTLQQFEESVTELHLEQQDEDGDEFGAPDPTNPEDGVTS